MGDFTVAAEGMNLAEKEEFLREIGQESLIKAFDGYKPRRTFRKKRREHSAPLDQKMSLTVTRDDRAEFEKLLKETHDSGENVSMSHYVRNRALATPDLYEWKGCAISGIKQLKETVENKSDFLKRDKALISMIEEEKDSDVVALYLRERGSIADKLSRLKARPTKRTQRLSGRVTFEESELIKWRAARLCLSTSDYLRMMIFDLSPHGASDAHLSLVARQRFYIAIGDVATHGWGQAPALANSNQQHLVKRIKELEQENKQLKEILHNERES